MCKPLVMGNWKSYGSLAFAKNLCESIQNINTEKVDVILFVPYPYLNFVSTILDAKGIGYGAQNVSAYSEGAYTGEVHSQMLADLGINHVLIGHSERRSLFAEDNLTVSKKVKLALDAGLSVVLCVGESKDQRESNQQTEIVKIQLQSVLRDIKDDQLQRLTIAYEPVWAIGTGLAATANDVLEMHRFIRQTLQNHNQKLAKMIRIVYGGSVKPQNASELFQLENVDGGLIGGASLDADKFVQIVNMA
ncbi:triose-phosphate isomerase [Thiotrichales bacterium 19X7-9]|nr:triose-phosphate isomerase [Thiotrichales bacterium 19X7-9]